MAQLSAPYIYPDLFSDFYSQVHITIEIVGAGEIRYTLDGSEPTESSSIYLQHGFYRTVTTTVKAKVFRDGYTPSPTTTKIFTKLKASAPVISPSGGNFTGTISVSISSSDDGAIIKYSTNGSTPTSSSSTLTYTSPIILSSPTTTIKAKAFLPSLPFVGSDTVGSDISIATFQQQSLTKVSTPVVSIESGQYVNSISVSASCYTPGAIIRYYLGTMAIEPTNISPQYPA
ncbi:MAG: chitobiase/beta-hexosaminidase C-terminal domain-containing protein, partial [Clostridia bacterium]